ncbi:MAG: carboxypeptidase regulatory-like domain-containing protein [Nanoarchaeota archaeon]|nr:carboxypeptidase regulatory-like domain-containing protein [Nanoarchaeota archaeon]
MKGNKLFGLLTILTIFLISITAASAAEIINGTVTDATGAIIPGASVGIYDLSSNLVTSNVTDVNGFYILNTDVTVNTHYVFNFTAVGYDDDEFDKVVEDEVNYTVNRTLGPLSIGHINGTITNSTGVLSGVSIIVTGNNTYYTSTDGNGEYELPVVAPGTYTVLASTPGYGDNSTQGVVIIKDANETVDMELSQFAVTGTLQGVVNNYTNNSEYINGATVSLNQGNVTVAIVTTSGTGNYTVDVPAGTYDVVVSMVEYNDATASVTIVNGAVETQDFSLIHQDATCTQEGPIYTEWGTCTSGQRTRNLTYYNHSGVCGVTQVTVETQNCGDSPPSRRSGGSSGMISGLALPFGNYVTHIYDQLLASKDKYVMEVGSEDIAIYELEFAVKDDVKRTVILSVGRLLERLKKNLEGEVYEFDVINHQNVANEEFSYVKARFKVLKTWYTENDLNLSTTALHRYDQGWNKLPTEQIFVDDEYHYFESDLPGFSEFAIHAEKNVVPEEDEEEEPVNEILGLTEEEVQELMDTCQADGMKSVPVIGEDGEVLDIECVEYNEQSLVGRAWAVFSGFMVTSWKWVIALLLLAFGPKIFKRKDDKKKAKPAKKAPKKETEVPGISDVNVFTRMWRGVSGRKVVKDEKWFAGLDDKEFEKLVKQRKKARLERRKKYLK